MATTIVNPAPNNDSNNGMGFIIGAIIIVIFVALFFVYGLPLIRGMNLGNGVQINVPKSIDVNVKQSK